VRGGVEAAEKACDPLYLRYEVPVPHLKLAYGKYMDPVVNKA